MTKFEWKKISILGSGAFGEVLLFRNDSTNDCLAIKQCKIKAVTPKQKERWDNEVRIMKSLNCPNIVGYKAIPSDLEQLLLKSNSSKLALLPMEYCTKGNLRRILRKPENLCGLPEKDIRLILSDILNGLSYLHKRNITHRDIKPDNIVLHYCDKRESKTIYKIIDLGFAKEINNTVSVVGTLHYLAPEIIIANKYTSNVDYWSLGILTYEMICGTLPFFPHLTPIERLDKIKNKHPDHISIYLAHNKNVVYSSELRKENYISSCLQRFIEIWLRHVLQFDPNKRTEYLMNEVNVFEYLQQALQKKIVTVFSVFKLEFYSYEINESTLLSTLKDWISRDIKVPVKSFTLLVNEEFFGLDDGILVNDVLRGDSDVLYVFKKTEFINKSVTFYISTLLKEVLFKSVDIDNVLLLSVLAQSIYCTVFENKSVQAFCNAMKMYCKYVRYLVETVEEKSALIVQRMEKACIKLECYNKIKKSVPVDYSKFGKDSLSAIESNLKTAKLLLNNFVSVSNSSNDLELAVQKLRGRQNNFVAEFPSVEETISNCNLEKFTYQVYSMINREQHNMNANQLKTIISQCIKEKDSMLFKNQIIRNYFQKIIDCSNYSEELLAWMNQFEQRISDLSQTIEDNEISYQTILVNATKISTNLPNEVPLSEHTTEELIRQNQDIRFTFSEEMLELNATWQSYKKFINKS